MLGNFYQEDQFSINKKNHFGTRKIKEKWKKNEEEKTRNEEICICLDKLRGKNCKIYTLLFYWIKNEKNICI